jgi:hypothetical protein
LQDVNGTKYHPCSSSEQVENLEEVYVVLEDKEGAITTINREQPVEEGDDFLAHV